jgi:hypothetical protein
MDVEIVWARIVFGFPLDGNVPGAWSGIPFDARARVVSLQVHFARLVRFSVALGTSFVTPQ